MKLRLFSKLMLLVMLPVFAILMALSGFTYLTAERIMRKQIDADMVTILAQQTQEYRSFYNNMSDVVSALSKRGEIVAALVEKDAEAAADETGEVLEQYPLIKRMELFDANGKEFYAKGSLQPFADYAKENFFSKLTGGPAAMVFQKGNTAELVLVLGAPIRDAQKLLGYVLFTFPVNELGQTYSDRIRVGTSGKVFVLDDKGVVLLDPTDKGSIGQNISSIDWIRTMLASPSGVIRYEWNGVPKSCYYERVDGLNWTLGLGFTDEDLLGPLTQIRNEALLVSLGAVLLLTAIVFGIARSVAIPLRSTVAFMQEVGEGHMQVNRQLVDEQNNACRRYDEIGDLARGCRGMHEHLVKLLGDSERNAKEANAAAEQAQVATARAEEALTQAQVTRQETIQTVTSQLADIAESLSAAAGALSERIEQSGHGSVEQAGRVAQTAAAMEEMNATVHEVAKNASAASSVSANTRRKAEEGAAVVGEALSSIKDVQRNSLALKEDMAALGEYAGSISQIMGVISDIADQTNLLALNAAIEAARAGEAGRGFAVVADEVRKLAEKTMASTTDVGNAIRAIQQSADKNIAQVEQAVGLIDKATALSSRSGEALQEIVRMVDDTADQVRAIASASEQQSATSGEINQSIELVNSIASETASSMQEAEREVQNLAVQARQLADLIENLKKSNRA